MYYLVAEPCLATNAVCTDTCPMDTIGLGLRKPVGSEPLIGLAPGECSDCTACIVACPVSALTH
jgi:NAD-dependent dihydropyrimidine dehydrogenase PreA subunit